MPAKILIVEDDPSQRDMLAILLQRKMHFDSIGAGDGRSALTNLQTHSDINLVILDMGLPEISGLETLEMIKQRHPDIPVIMLTGNRDLDDAVTAMRLGAADFLNKPVEKERLQVAIQNALKTSLLEKEVVRLKRAEQGAFTFDQLIGHDSGLTDVIKIGRKAAGSDIPVLLTGETGTGKEVFASAIHGESHRVGKPFVAVNCGAIPAQLVESILFGHEKGAFTGAIAKSIGKFREAEGGTIFLDEIGDLPLEAQVKILRVLQQKEISPVGGDHAIPVNVRIISATNRDLGEDVKAGRFRDDLYFRLNVLPIKLPSLRERREDLPLLIKHFIERFAASEGRNLKSISAAALTMLAKRPWPGNVRELENTIHRAMVLCDGPQLESDDFTSLSLQAPPASGKGEVINGGTIATAKADGQLRPLVEIEREAMEKALEHYGGNITKAAEALGMAKSTFYRRLKELSGS